MFADSRQVTTGGLLHLRQLPRDCRVKALHLRRLPAYSITDDVLEGLHKLLELRYLFLGDSDKTHKSPETNLTAAAVTRYVKFQTDRTWGTGGNGPGIVSATCVAVSV